VTITFVDITSELARLCRECGKRAIVKSLCLWAFKAVSLILGQNGYVVFQYAYTIEKAPRANLGRAARRAKKRQFVTTVSSVNKFT